MKNVIVFYVKITGKQLNAPASVKICEGRGGGGGCKTTPLLTAMRRTDWRLFEAFHVLFAART
jgi:hypothetical protein